MICIARTFGAPESVPAGSTERSASIAATPRRSVPETLRDDVHDVAVGLDRHERVDVHRPVLAHPPEVVASEVDEHDVLGALLLVGQQTLGDHRVLGGVGAARARPGDGPRRDVVAASR